MIIKTRKEIPSSEITPEAVYRDRRKFLKTGAMAAFGVAGGSGLLSSAALVPRPVMPCLPGRLLILTWLPSPPGWLRRPPCTH